MNVAEGLFDQLRPWRTGTLGNETDGPPNRLRLLFNF